MKLYEPRRGLYWELGVGEVYFEDGEIVTELPQDIPPTDGEVVRANRKGRAMKARSASEIYRDAAELMASGAEDFSCCAISAVMEKLTGRYEVDSAIRQKYERTFGIGTYTYMRNRKHRVLSLLLMSEIAKGERRG